MMKNILIYESSYFMKMLSDTENSGFYFPFVSLRFSLIPFPGGGFTDDLPTIHCVLHLTGSTKLCVQQLKEKGSEM